MISYVSQFPAIDFVWLYDMIIIFICHGVQVEPTCQWYLDISEQSWYVRPQAGKEADPNLFLYCSFPGLVTVALAFYPLFYSLRPHLLECKSFFVHWHSSIAHCHGTASGIVSIDNLNLKHRTYSTCIPHLVDRQVQTIPLVSIGVAICQCQYDSNRIIHCRFIFSSPVTF